MRLLTLALVLGLSSFSWAHEHHSDEVCHPIEKNVCVHMGFDNLPELENEFQFVVHVVAPQNTISQIRDVKVDLWMDMGGHGHGSAPVTVKRLNADHFSVTEAYFVMPGVWQVRVKVQTTTKAYDFVIPVEVNK